MQKIGRTDDLSAADVVKLPWPQLRSLIDAASPGLRKKLLEHGLVYFHVAIRGYEKNVPMLIEKLRRFRFTRHLGKMTTSILLLFVSHL